MADRLRLSLIGARAGTQHWAAARAGTNADLILGGGRAAPQFRRRELRAFGERFQLRPHDGRMNAPIEDALSESAIGAADNALARRTNRSATSFGCSTTLVVWAMTPGMSTRSGGNLAFSQTRHSCSWRGLAISSE